ncbi:heavy metal-associated isoprenylated plant protein 43-like [Cryptomeria japonica]|uniref:heavy metal-associated isoprenylated plant protein 43-like n=1 Tax=Cryptomeria japonica TaxID=3369 RepID=UPI0027D9F745|nr:heavy metal-associated isoprenylated plant protein 43-like [Cryptomeria japonica]
MHPYSANEYRHHLGLSSEFRHQGVNSVEVDTSKNIVTVTGEVDPVKITVEIRKLSKCAQIISVGPHPPPKKTEEKKEKKSQAEEKIYILPACCQRCEGGYYVYDDFDSQNYSFCTII